MDIYESALASLRDAIQLMDMADETLIAAHIATPIQLIEDRLLDGRRTGAA